MLPRCLTPAAARTLRRTSLPRPSSRSPLHPPQRPHIPIQKQSTPLHKRHNSTTSTISNTPPTSDASKLWPLDPLPPTTTPLPLHGIRILDLSRVLAGPFCTQILADYGASVLKIEQPLLGDETRHWRADGETAQFWKSDNNDTGPMSLYHAAINRNKRSLTLNLKSPSSRPILETLVRCADVVVHNFLPRATASLHLDYATLSALNPRVIYAAISGYGATGPKRDRAGYDAIALAESGLLHITGHKDDPRGPVKPGVAVADLCTGLYVHGGILAGLRARETNGTGRGVKVQGSLLESSLSLLINVGLGGLNLDLDGGGGEGEKKGRRTGGRYGLGHASLVPYGGFETGDKGRMVFVAANNNRQWKKLCEVMEVRHLAEEQRFATNDGRVENREEINRLLGERFKEKSLKEWLEVFDGSGLPYGPINNVVEALEDEQSVARDMVMEIDDFEAAKNGVLKTIGPAVKFGGVKMGVRRKPAKLGEHTEEVLRDLGYSGMEIDELRREQVV